MLKDLELLIESGGKLDSKQYRQNRAQYLTVQLPISPDSYGILPLQYVYHNLCGKI